MSTGLRENQVLDDLGEGRPLWQTCCLGCLFALAAVIVGTLVVILLFGGTGIEQVKTVPANFPKEITIFKLESAKGITVLGGGQRGRILGIILSPIKLFKQFQRDKSELESGLIVSTAPLRIEWLGKQAQPESWFDKALRLAEGVDTVSISWEDLPATRQDVLDYYQRMFAKAGMKTRSSVEASTRTDFLEATKDGLDVQVHVQAAADGKNIDNLVVIVSYRNR